MEHQTCFSSALALTSKPCPPTLSGLRTAVLCTLAPQRSKTRSESAFRVLPPNLPESERPPSAPRHHSIPYIGFFIADLLGKLEDEDFAKYGGIFNSNYFLEDQTYVSDYNAITQMMRAPDIFNSSSAFAGVDVMIKDSLLSLDGVDHDKARSLLTPAFSTVLFPFYFPFVARRGRAIWERVHKRIRNGETVKLDPVFREHYLALTIEMTTGQDADGALSERIRNLFYKLQFGFFSYRLGPLAKPALDASDELLQILCGVVRDNLVRRRDTIERLRSYGGDIAKLGAKDMKTGEVDVLLVAIATSTLSTEPGAELDTSVVQGLAYSMMFLWLAGYMTSAATSTSATMELGMDPSIQAKLIAEQDEIVKKAGGVRDVTYEQTASEMPLLDSYLTEILRLFPPVTGMGRVANHDVEILNCYFPKGRAFFCDFDSAHRDAKLYPDPNKLIPERFLATPKPPPVLSFGPPGSAHYCIGSHFAKTMMRTTFATMLREYSITLDPKQSRKYRYIPEKSPKSLCVVTDLQPRP